MRVALVLLAALALTVAGIIPPVRAEPAGAAALAAAMGRHDVVLLGEIHDNRHHHRLRHAALAMRVAAGWRPALVMEQFDRERQPDIDRARRERPRDADHLIAAAASGVRSNWLWAEYRPFVQLALDHDLPLLAGNMSRAELTRIRQDGVAILGRELVSALGLDRPIPEDIIAALEKEIDRGHCGQAPPELLPLLARSQAIRDAWMAYLVRQHAATGVVLLAGNGHVRLDIGVPRWLDEPSRSRLLAVGLLEAGPPGLPETAFHQSFTTPAVTRPDPCAAFAS